jgi:spoIIIJ-associated protein
MTANTSANQLTPEAAAEIALSLLHQLEFPQAQAEVNLKEEGEVQLKLQVGEEAGVLIGYHGEGIQSLQTLLALIFYRKTGVWYPVRVDIDGYLERRTEQLAQMAQEAVERVLSVGKSETLPYLSGNERRIIHELLSEDGRVTTESFGEGRERRLVISPK